VSLRLALLLFTKLSEVILEEFHCVGKKNPCVILIKFCVRYIANEYIWRISHKCLGHANILL